MVPVTYISIGISLLVIGFNCAMFIIIKFNDMAHLSKDVAEIKADVKTLIDREIKTETSLAKIQVRCQERHRRSRIQ